MQLTPHIFVAALGFAICLNGVNVSQAQPPFPQNSLRKIRVEPGPIAARIGASFHWETDFETAMKKSAESGKPVFWYVPTLRGSFMDRVDSVNRYMLAGPFSWPDIISLLNQHTIPLQSRPSAKQQREFDLRPYVFIEPGFLILKPDGVESFRVDRLTTLRPDWFRHLLTDSLQLRHPHLPTNQSVELSEAWKLFREGRYDDFQFDSLQDGDPRSDEANPDRSGNPRSAGGSAALDPRHPRLGPLKPAQQLLPAETTEMLLLAGMFDFRLGKHDSAIEKWKRASLIDPTHPLAAKAAAEAEGFGPFVRGFETHRNLPTEAFTIPRPTRGSMAPANLYDADSIWKRSTEFLLGMQSENGAFTDSDYDFGGTDSLPNVHVAVTAIAGMALLRSRDYFAGDGEFGRRIDRAIQTATTFVSTDTNLNFQDRDELAWAMIYRVEFLSQLARRGDVEAPAETPARRGEVEAPAETRGGDRFRQEPQPIGSLPSVTRQKRQDLDVRARLTALVGQLESLQTESGNWFHEYSNSFVTASAVLALESAQSAGVPISAGVLEKGATALARDRFQIGAFPYSSSGRPSGTGQAIQVAESAGRMPLCELALWKTGKSDDAKLGSAVNQSLKHHRHLMSALKYDDHTSNMAYGGFFFWYDVRGRCAAINHLADADARQSIKKSQRDLILALPEIDGCFVDSHELGRVYGTAMALISLADSASEVK